MIFFSKDRTASLVEKPRGGQGRAEGLHLFAPESRPARTHFKALAGMTLPAGSAIGFHVHENEEEAYIITEGQGLFTDADGAACPVFPGDVTLTRSGEGHGLQNIGPGPLTFTAVVTGPMN